MTQKGQVTISAGLRNALGLKPSDQVTMSLEPDGIIRLERMKTVEEVLASLPLVTMQPVDWKTLREEVHEEIAEKIFRQIAEASERRKKNASY